HLNRLFMKSAGGTEEANKDGLRKRVRAAGCELQAPRMGKELECVRQLRGTVAPTGMVPNQGGRSGRVRQWQCGWRSGVSMITPSLALTCVAVRTEFATLPTNSHTLSKLFSANSCGERRKVGMVQDQVTDGEPGA